MTASTLSSVNATLNNSIGYINNADKFGRTIRLLGIKAPSPPGWEDYTKRSAQGATL